jgi:tRNA(Ile)-lysidine synthase
MLELFNIKDLDKEKKILVAVSGGSDSLALLLLANKWANISSKKICAITIDHKIREESKDEAIYVNNLCKNYGIEHIIKTCQIPVKSEEEARNVRYNFIFDYMKEQNIKVVLLAHHIQDNAENFLIRLFRGSGINGLSSMEMISYRNDYTIIRPFLNVRKDELQQYLNSENIKWCEDKSNEDEKYLRNKIRSFLNSFTDKDLIINRINKTIQTLQKANNIIKNKIETVNPSDGCVVFSLSKFNKMEQETQFQYISTVIEKISDSPKKPRADGIEKLIEKIQTIKNYTLHGCVFHKLKNVIVVFKE